MSKVYTFDEIEQHNTRDDLWLVIEGKVYDCSNYIDEHPGGEEVIVDCAGTDATEAFEDIGHSEDARDILKGLHIGDLDPSSKPTTSSKSNSSTDDSSATNPIFLIIAAVVALAAAAYFVLNK
ncbi:hypothetical protein PACTADRAFT_49429 [Pachysolen tannophilus NRRL Y-2460]|uniref:Cytochrome b5 heme-binding domain-containing protein n=1 Tax=Pachysolen tannophilus NRRL Y-2460 TaxID=669874 RepID=A0A1E4TW97_PACTA|nr:hypothetical protein PACTADRAFT_49429 [Pachysolen tannophilus NRRL Y-2460]